MKTSELRKLIREEARKVIAANKQKQLNEGPFDKVAGAVKNLFVKASAKELADFADIQNTECGLCKKYGDKRAAAVADLNKTSGITKKADAAINFAPTSRIDGQTKQKVVLPPKSKEALIQQLGIKPIEMAKKVIEDMKKTAGTEVPPATNANILGDAIIYGALLYLSAKKQLYGVLNNSLRGVYDKAKDIFSTVTGKFKTTNPNPTGASESMEFALRKTIREIAKKEIAAKKLRK